MAVARGLCEPLVHAGKCSPGLTESRMLFVCFIRVASNDGVRVRIHGFKFKDRMWPLQKSMAVLTCYYTILFLFSK